MATTGTPISKCMSICSVTITMENELMCPWMITPLLSVTCNKFGRWLSKTSFHRRNQVFREERVKLDKKIDAVAQVKRMKYDEMWDVGQSLV